MYGAGPGQGGIAEDYDEMSPDNLLNSPGAAKELAARNRKKMSQERQAKKAMFTPAPAPKKPDIDLGKIAHLIMITTAEVFPDTDPMDWLVPELENMGIRPDDAMQLLDRAAQTHLGVRSCSEYIADFKDQFISDNPDLAAEWNIPRKSNEGVAGGIVGGAAGGLITKSVGGAMTGAEIGSAVQDMLTTEGAKVDRMVKHVASSEKRLGKSGKEATSIAWATANKRGMLDNKKGK
jgi:hypothetical protein